MTVEEAKTFEPSIIFVNHQNKIIEKAHMERHGEIK